MSGVIGENVLWVQKGLLVRGSGERGRLDIRALAWLSYCECTHNYPYPSTDLPVSRTPIDIPVLEMSPVRRRASLQNGIAHIPKAVTSIEIPVRQEKGGRPL